jgi:hypothetical protein
MRNLFMYGIGAVVSLSLVAPTAAHAQKVTKGTISGTLFTASATANATSVPLYTAPASAKGGVPIVTAFCGVVDDQNQTITGSTLGNVAVSALDGNVCFEFAAGGLPLPPGEVLTYENVGTFDASVRIIGILSKK